MTKPVQLILMPGLGADSRLLGLQASCFEKLVVPPWIDPLPRESLPDYACRLAETLTLQSDVPLVLGGVSLGGMIAYEMACHLKSAALVLISTCRTREGLARYRPLSPLARRLPGAAIGLAKCLSPVVVRLFMPWPAEVRTLGIDMFRRADPVFLRWATAALLDWQPSDPPNLPVFQIHGRHDRAIPVSQVQADMVVPDGGHLINMTHPAEVNAFIESVLEKVAL